MDKVIEEFKIRRAKRLDAKKEDNEEGHWVTTKNNHEVHNKKWNGTIIDKSRVDDDDDDDGNGGSGGSHGNTKIPFGLCQREGIEIGENWTPKDAWNALEGKGYSAGSVYKNLRETGKAGNPSGGQQATGQKPDRKAMREKARAAHEAKSKELSDANEKFERVWHEYTAMRDMQGTYDEFVKIKKERLDKCERIKGRSDEELEAERGKLEKQIQDNADAIKKASKRPKPGAPEREEWDKWYSDIGKKRGVDYLKEKNQWLEADKKELDDLIEFKKKDPDGADIEKAREAYDTALKKCEDHKKAVQDKYEESGRLRERIPAIEAEQRKERQAALKEIRDSFSSYDECETTQDIADRLSGGGFFRDGKEADLEGVDLETARTAAKRLEKMFDDFPALKGRLGELTVDREGALRSRFGGAAYAGSERDGSVFLNPDKWGNPDALQKDIDEDVLKKFHPPGTTATSLIMHEYTHQIDDLLTKKLSQLTGGMWSSGKLSEVIKYEVQKRLDIWGAEIEDGVSGYATHDPQEWLAEACSEFFTSKNPRPIAQETGKVLTEYLQKYNEIAGVRHDSADVKIAAFRSRRELRLRDRYGDDYGSIMSFRARRNERRKALTNH